MSPYTEEELSIFAEFGDHCARCGQTSIVLHEIVPKSKRPKTWNTSDNRIPLCCDCHVWAHQRGTKGTINELRYLRFNSQYRKQEERN